jgi:hypothetical protein
VRLPRTGHEGNPTPTSLPVGAFALTEPINTITKALNILKTSNGSDEVWISNFVRGGMIHVLVAPSQFPKLADELVRCRLHLTKVEANHGIGGTVISVRRQVTARVGFSGQRGTWGTAKLIKSSRSQHSRELR